MESNGVKTNYGINKPNVEAGAFDLASPIFKSEFNSADTYCACKAESSCALSSATLVWNNEVDIAPERLYEACAAVPVAV